MDPAVVWCTTFNSLFGSCWSFLMASITTMNNTAEDYYLRAENMSNLLNQIIFFMLCDHWFCPDEKLTGLYSLLFYNVLCYLLAYCYKLLKYDYTPYVRVSEHTNIKHLAMTATKIVLDLTKAVTFVITGVFMLLVFGLEQGLEYFNPSWIYVIITFVYFIISEKSCQLQAPTVLTWLQLDVFESLELLWAPVLLRLASSLLSVLMITVNWLCTDGGWFVIAASSYVNVYLGLKDMDRHWKVLLQERACLDKYRFATRYELNERDDVCPVCLQAMMFARITPCHHFFHGDCLRRCLKERTTCPVCKQEL